jgi:hypothetical protein
MKHLINKNLFQGGGKDKPKPQPPLLKPPQLGAYRMLNSYSVAEVIDLISDGPIEGIVNQNGYRLGQGSSILQGIYLDNTPIEKTPSQQSSTLQAQDIIGDLKIYEILNQLGELYYNENNTLRKDFHKPKIVLNSKKKKTSQFPESNIISTNTKEAGSAKQSYYSPIIGKQLGQTNNTGNGWEWKGNLNDDSARFFRTQTLDLEVHYENVNKSLFSEGSLLKEFKNKLTNSNLNIGANAQKLINEKIIEKIISLEDSIKNKKFDWSTTNTCFVVVKIQGKLEQGQNTDKSYFKNQKPREVSFELSNFSENIPQKQIHKLIVSKVDQSNNYLMDVEGCLVIEIPTTYAKYEGIDEQALNAIRKQAKGAASNFILKNYDYYYRRQFFSDLSGFIKKNTKLVFKNGPESDILGPSKYNFSGVSCEFRDGDEFQTPLNNFTNIYIDYDYGSPLSGPFRTSGIVRRIQGNWKNRGASNPDLNILIGQEEGSNDQRSQSAGKQQSFSDWNNDNQYDESPVPIIHTIENPNVSSVFFTLSISNLSDTLSVASSQERELGDKVPAIVEIEVEWGKISNGKNLASQTRRYAIAAIVEGQMLIDFGSPDLKDEEDKLKSSLDSVRDLETDKIGKPAVLSNPFELPDLDKGENPSVTKRYIKITKLSAETNSVLLKKEISLYKVTEVLEQNFSYPFSSIVGMKLNATSFGSVPERTYDCRFKKIQIPSNYKPLQDNGIDKRYIKSESDYAVPNLVYDGDWDGQFIEGWTDNPAWIIYDLLTSKRYGLGSYLEPDQINIWELYKIGRFCDAVDSEGYFEGVSDGVGGLEPRYSCNIVFREQTKIFDAINIVASLFRGSVFFSNSEIQFLDDRPRDPISIFTNSNVKDGVFNYINNRRDQQFNTVEVAYLDRFDNYQTKIEYVQDEADIRKRGIFKTDINTLGVTSRAMARRIGQHLIYQTIKENQSIEFRAGLESLLCRPGDLIIVEDEMKTRSTNYGRILNKDVSLRSLDIDNFYDTGSFSGKVTVYSPTGFTTSDELESIVSLQRNRVPYFDITGNLLEPSDSALTGRYYFSGYIAGYVTGNPFGLSNQFPLYTGSGTSEKIFCYYNTGATGFVFSTGFAYTNNNLYDKVICSTGLMDVTYFESGADQTGYRYDSASPNKRGATFDKINENFVVEFKNSYQGILDSEISTVNNPQITTFDISSTTNLDYGARLFLDPNDININLLPLVSEGSIYRIQRKNATDQIYKIISIREENQNEYNVYASKYDTGKFKEIENHITSDFLPETFTTSVPVINGREIIQLNPPNINTFTTGSISSTGFSLSGSWNSVTDATGYLINIENLTTRSSRSIIQTSSPFDISGLQDMGYWEMRILSLAESPDIDSTITKTGFFVAYESATQLTASVTVGFSIG